MGAPSPLLDREEGNAATNAREWRVQQVGWVVLALVVLAALAGVFGTGPVSWSRALAVDGSISVDYPRFARNGGQVALRLRVAPSAAVDGQVRVSLSHELLESVEVSQIVPEPESQATTDEGVVLTFAVEGDATLQASVSGTGDAMGWHEGAVALEGAPPLVLGQFFYP